MLSLGTSVSWEDAIAVLTDGRSNFFSTDAIIEYFRPLYKWLIKFNKDNKVPVGWYTKNLPVNF